MRKNQYLLVPGEHNGRSKRRFDMLNSTFTGCEDTSKNLNGITRTKMHTHIPCASYQVVRIRIKPCEKLQGSSQLNAACEMYQGAPKPMCQINNRSDFV